MLKYTTTVFHKHPSSASDNEVDSDLGETSMLEGGGCENWFLWATPSPGGVAGMSCCERCWEK